MVLVVIVGANVAADVVMLVCKTQEQEEREERLESDWTYLSVHY